MSTTQTILVLGILILTAIVAAVAGQMRRQKLRRRFGTEYDYAVTEHSGRAEAERELRDRERLHTQLTLIPLTAETRAWYAEQWQRVQERFVDDPREAIVAADELVSRLAGELGYPVGDHDQQLALLSVDHASVVGDYRLAHRIWAGATDGTWDTEQWRQAVVHYRAVVTELLGSDPVPQQGDKQTHQHHERTAS